MMKTGLKLFDAKDNPARAYFDGDNLCIDVMKGGSIEKQLISVSNLSYIHCDLNSGVVTYRGNEDDEVLLGSFQLGKELIGCFAGELQKLREKGFYPNEIIHNRLISVRAPIIAIAFVAGLASIARAYLTFAKEVGDDYVQRIPIFALFDAIDPVVTGSIICCLCLIWLFKRLIKPLNIVEFKREKI